MIFSNGVQSQLASDMTEQRLLRESSSTQFDDASHVLRMTKPHAYCPPEAGMATLCDIRHVRPATVRASIVPNGEQEALNRCDVGYRRLARRQLPVLSLESLFGDLVGSLVDNVFDYLWSDLPAG
jgi:hypothetical protein